MLKTCMYACDGAQPCQRGPEYKGVHLREWGARGSFMNDLAAEIGLGYWGRPHTLRDEMKVTPDGGISKSKEREMGKKKTQIPPLLGKAPHHPVPPRYGISLSHSFLHGWGKLDGTPSGKQTWFLLCA